MWEAMGIVMLVLIGIGKFWVFGHSVRQALMDSRQSAQPGHPDRPDGDWRWWEEFEPEPGPKPGSPDRVLLRRS